MGLAVVLFIAILLVINAIGYLNDMADHSGIMTIALFVGTIGIGVLSMLNML